MSDARPTVKEVAREARPILSELRTLLTGMDELWHSRLCWICGGVGNCGHREYAADVAELRALVLAIGREEGS